VAGLKTSAALQTRVGFATGLVVVGDLIGTGSAQEQTVVGETPNLAARLQAEATPDTIAIEPTTRGLLAPVISAASKRRASPIGCKHTRWCARTADRARSAPAEALPPRPSRQAHHQLAHMRAACSAVAVAIERACLSFCGTLLPRRGLKLGYLVQEDGEQIRGGLVSGAAGFIGLHCLPKQPFSVRLWHDPVLYQGRETKLRKLKSSDSRGGCMKLVEFLIIHSLSPTCD
jgi:Adenylate and Guanylate cyclase catalytic domain